MVTQAVSSLALNGRYEQPDQEGIEISGLDVGMPVVGHVATV